MWDFMKVPDGYIPGADQAALHDRVRLWGASKRTPWGCTSRA